MPAVFAITRISDEDFAIGLVIRRGHTPDLVNVSVMGLCALVPAKVRRRHATFGSRNPRYDGRDGN